MHGNRSLSNYANFVKASFYENGDGVKYFDPLTILTICCHVTCSK